MATLKTDAPFYTEKELDVLKAMDPAAALRIAREQTQLKRQLDAAARLRGWRPMGRCRLQRRCRR